MIGLEDGSHLQVPNVDMIKVKAVRLEPKSNEGHLTVDGEPLEHGDVQVSVLPSAGRVLVK